MTEPARRVIALLTESPAAWCDDCIAKELGFAKRQQAQAVTSVLEETPLYDRYRGACFRCVDAPKNVIARKVVARA